MTRGSGGQARDRYIPQEWMDQVEKQRLQLQREREEELLQRPRTTPSLEAFIEDKRMIYNDARAGIPARRAARAEISTLNYLKKHGYSSQTELSRVMHVSNSEIAQVAKRLCSHELIVKGKGYMKDSSGGTKMQVIYYLPGAKLPAPLSKTEDSIIEILSKRKELSRIQLQIRLNKSPSYIREKLGRLVRVGKVVSRRKGNTFLYRLKS